MKKRITLSEVVKAADHNIASFIAEAAVQLNDLGLSNPNSIPFNWQAFAICAYDGSKLIGIIHFSLDDNGTSYWVLLGYVKLVYRRRGIYRRLWRKLVEHARKNKVTRISGSTHVNNAPMRAFYRDVGRAEKFVTGFYKVKN